MALLDRKELGTSCDDTDSGLYLSGEMSDQNSLQRTCTKEVDGKAVQRFTSFEQSSSSSRKTTQKYREDDIQTDATPIDIQHGRNVTDFTRLALDEALSRPKDQFNQQMKWESLINIAIVFAKEDFNVAEELKQWLFQMTERNGLGKIVIELINSETFPPNHVNVVDDLMNRTMRVLMLLSPNFQKHSEINFLKEECVAKSRLQDMSPCKDTTLFSTKVLKRRRKCIRPVHFTDTHMYEIPAGLAALRSLNFTGTKRDTPFEQNEFLQVIKGSIEDLEEHTEILNSNLPIRNSVDLSDHVVTGKNLIIDNKIQQRSSASMGIQSNLNGNVSISDITEIDNGESDDENDIETDAQNLSSPLDIAKTDSNYACVNGIGIGGGPLVITRCEHVSVSTGGQVYVSKNQLERNNPNERQTKSQFSKETAV